jgi:hypothetical protein
MLPLLFEDVVIKICDGLSDSEKISLTSISSNMNKLKYKLIYCTKIDIAKIYLLPYFDNFENIEIHGNPPKFPRYVKYVHYTTFTLYIVPHTTHLTISSYINLSNDIPPSVTHLTFDCSIVNIPSFEICIPSSVTHLTLNRGIYRKIDLALLPNITHLQIRPQYNFMLSNRTFSPRLQIIFLV